MPLSPSKLQLTQQLRASLRRHGELITAHTSFDRMIKMVEKINGAPLSKTTSELHKQLHRFCLKNISHDLPKTEFKKLVNYNQTLHSHQVLAMSTRK